MDDGWAGTPTVPSERTSALRTESGSRPGRAVAAACYGPVKAGAEWVAALALLVALAPLFAALAVLLALTSEGPVLYSQVRLGRNGRPFRIYKLRTMLHGCEAATGPVWSVAGDPRVTRVGRWLRDTHLDELPQLWNVVRGEMSLIGPRPERPEIAAQLERWLPEFRERLRVRPGITGLAQMKLPPDSNLDTVQRKLVHDLHYIENLGAALDARIAVSTGLYFVGRACTAVSRWVVGPLAPTRVFETPIVPPRLGLSTAELGLTGAPAGGRTGGMKAIEGELTRAA